VANFLRTVGGVELRAELAGEVVVDAVEPHRDHPEACRDLRPVLEAARNDRRPAM
jgi:hypothetical protein